MYRLAPVFLLLASCADTVEETPVAEPAAIDLSICKGEGLEDMIGQPVADNMGRLPEGARVIGPDTLVTQDYRPNRLNAATDANGVVTGLTCG